MQKRYNHGNEHSNLLVNGLKGAIAGAVGVWVMDQVDWFLFKNEDPAARAQTESVRPGGLDPAHVAVNKAAEVAGTHFSSAQPNSAGVGLHYALGMAPGALYGAFRDRLPASAEGQDHLYGAALGLGLFAVQDEGLNAITGLSADPRKYPWQAHARGLLAHVVLGLTTNAVLNLLGAPRPSPESARQPAGAHNVTDEAENLDQNRPLPPMRIDEAQAWIR